MKSLGVLDILGFYGFDPNCRAKLVRHKDIRYPVEEMLRKKWLDLYQSYQGKPRFDNLDVIVSFYGQTGTRACFYGAFKVLRRRPGREGRIDANCPWVKEWRKICPYYYELERVPGYEALERRLVIDWGKGAINWHQHLSKDSNKRVLELMPEGRWLPVFEDYLEFTLPYSELRDLYQYQDAHRDWKAALEAVAGVYLILAETTGHQYVGSAYGVAGVWGRWEQYTKTRHGGNKKLVDLLAQDADYPDSFHFSLLQVLPKTLTRDEVIKREALYKGKLGTRATGLNLN
jgi:hypothetical protein